MRHVRPLRLSVVLLLAIVFLGGCGKPADTNPNTPQAQTLSTIQAGNTNATETPDPAPSAAESTETTYPIEVVRFAEQFGASLEEADALLAGQRAQYLAMDRLYELVDDDLIVEGAFGEYPRSDELTIFVVDEQAAEVVASRVADAGLDPAKTFVEVAREERNDPWAWLDEEPYAGRDWLTSPGPHVFGPWRLLGSNGLSQFAEFGTRWALYSCPTYQGRILTSAERTLALTFNMEDPDCQDAGDHVDEQALTVVEDNGGEFEVATDEKDRMIWRGSTGDTLVWEPLDDTFESGVPVYPADRDDAYETWAQSLAAEMEGIWHLLDVDNEDPAAPVSLYVGVSTIGFEGQCNDMEGLFAVSADHRLALYLARTNAQCADPTGDVEEQMDSVLRQNGGMLRLSIEHDTMAWTTETGTQIIWSR